MTMFQSGQFDLDLWISSAASGIENPWPTNWLLMYADIILLPPPRCWTATVPQIVRPIILYHGIITLNLPWHFRIKDWSYSEHDWLSKGAAIVDTIKISFISSKWKNIYSSLYLGTNIKMQKTTNNIFNIWSVEGHSNAKCQKTYTHSFQIYIFLVHPLLCLILMRTWR